MIICLILLGVAYGLFRLCAATPPNTPYFIDGTLVLIALVCGLISIIGLITGAVRFILAI